MVNFFDYSIAFFNIFLFLITISIFGKICSMFLKIRKIPATSYKLSTFFTDFGIGFTFYIIFEYIFVTIWNINWFSGFWFFLIADIIYVGIRLFNEDLRFQFKSRIKEVSMKKNQKFSKSELLKIILLSFVLLIYLFGLMFIPEMESGLPEWDVIDWMGGVFSLLKTKQLDYSAIGAYPVGFIFFYSGIMNIGIFGITNLNILYGIFKLWPLLFIFFTFYIIFKIWKKNFNSPIVFGFAAIFSLFFSFSFWTRSIISIPSSLCDFIFLIFLLNLAEEKLNFSRISILFAGMILIHPFNGIFYVVLSVFFFLFILFIKKERDLIGFPKDIDLKRKYIFVLRIFIKPCLIFISLISIWFIHLSIIFSPSWINNYLYYFTDFRLNIFQNTIIWFQNLFDGIVSIRHIETYFIELSGSPGYYDNPPAYYFYSILHDLIICVFIGIFIPSKKIFKEQQNQRFILYMKYLFILFSIFWFFPTFINYVSSNTGWGLSSLIKIVNSDFYFTYKKRFLIMICIPAIFLFTYFWYSFFISMKKLILFIIRKKNLSLEPNLYKKKFENTFTIVFCMFLLIAQTDVNIKVYHFIPKSYTDITFEFREYQNDILKINPSLNSIIVDRDDYALYITFRSFFKFDHNFNYSYMNVSQNDFIDLLEIYKNIYNYIIISSNNQNWEYITSNLPQWGEVVLKSDVILIFKIVST